MTPGAEVSLAGQQIGLAPLFGAGERPGDAVAREAEAEGQAARLADWLAGESDAESRHGLAFRSMTPHELMLGSSFSLTAQAEDGGTVAL